MKIALDLHGVIDAHPKFFSELSRLFIEAGHEVFVITGSFIDDKLKDELKRAKIRYTALLSISQYHKEIGTHMWYDEKGNHWIDDELWNRTKADFCEKYQIDICFDDTEKYADYFRTPFFYCKLKK